MNAAAIAMLVVQYGIPLARQIWETLNKYEEPTQEMWDELLVLNSKSLRERLDAASSS